jgi:hypothetical protein
MRNSRFLFIGLAMIFTIIEVKVVVSQQHSECLAVITELRGDILVKKSTMKDFQKGVWGTQLFEDDQVKTSKESEVSLLFSNGNLISLGSNSTITISKGPSSTEQNTKSVKNIQTNMLADISTVTVRRTDEGNVGALAGLRSANEDQKVNILAPCNTVIRSNQPSFSWQSSGKFDTYVVTLYSSDGPLWSKEITKNELNYPVDKEQLDYGKSYFWQVEGKELFDSYKSSSIGFSVLKKEDVEEAEIYQKNMSDLFKDNPESSSYHFIMGSYYMKKGLLEDAIREFEMILGMNPDSPVSHEILGKLYQEVGQKDRAIAELQKALELSKK